MGLPDPRNYNGLPPMQVGLNYGLFLSPSRVQAPPGSLTNCRNFEVVNGAYEETQGLTLVGPALSEGLEDFWHADLDPADCSVTGTIQQGDLMYWYADDGVTVAGTGRIYYAYSDATTFKITLDRVAGARPRRATSFYTSSGATFVYSGTGNTFGYQNELGLTWDEYLGPAFLGAMVEAQKEKVIGWDEFKPDPLGVQGISGVFQLDDNIYAVRDFWGGKFVSGAEEPSIGDAISVDYGSAAGIFTALVAGYKLTSGSWEGGDAAGTLYLYPAPSTELDMTTVANWDDSTTITNTTTGNTLGSTPASGVIQYQNKGLLWKLDKERRQGGWSYVDMGFSVSFDTGTTAPIAEMAPLLTTDSLDTITDTGDVNLDSPATEYPSTGTYSAWSGLSNVTSATPGSYASTTLAASDYSRVMVLGVPQSVVPGTARILGVEVKITAHQTVGTDVVINKVQLRNSASGASKYLSDNRSDRQTLSTSTSTEYTFGAQLDLWGFDEITQADIDSGDLDLLIQFEDAGGAGRTVNVDEVQIVLHYAATSQKVYFYDGTSDVSEGSLYAYQVFDGDWSTDDAIGWMTLYDLTNPSSINSGCQIRSAASGGGSLIAEVRAVEKNLLPSLAEMDAVGAIYQSRRGSFSGNEDAEAVYVATGASPAFSLDREDRFSFIRLPIDRDKDKPRYVEIHRNHLVLSTGSHVLVSSIGAPNNFSTYDGATTWSLKDEVTGLAAAPNGTTMVACRDSIHTFTGSGATGQDAFAMRILTDNSGARPYTITNLLGNVFIDYAGITTADVSDKYGGFELGRQSAHVRPMLKTLLGSDAQDNLIGNRVVCAIPVRKKNQYRVYLSNGDIITTTFPDDPQQPMAYTRQNYTAYYEGSTRGNEATFVPTAIDSSVRSNGEEVIIIGTRIGHVMRVDPSYLDILSYANKDTTGSERRETLSSWKFFKYFDMTPMHASDPAQLTVYKSVEVYLEHAGYTEVNRLAKTDYERFLPVPVLGAPEDHTGVRVKVGDYSSFPGYLVDDYFTWYIDESTDGLSIRFSKFGGVGSTPTRLSALLFRAEAKGYGRDRIHDSHGYEIETASMPQDFYIEGTTAQAAATGNQGTVTFNVSITGTTATATATGNQGVVSFGPSTWSFDVTDVTMDETSPTWDGAR